MKTVEADMLADKICRTWQGKISAQIWSEALRPLELWRAERAWEMLRDNEVHPPTVALFRARYQALGVPAVPATDPFNKIAGAEAAATFAAVKGSGLRPLAALADECFAAAEAYRNATQQALF